MPIPYGAHWMRNVALLLTLSALLIAWKFSITVDYLNPYAKTVLAPSLLKVKVEGYVEPASGTAKIEKIDVFLGINNTQITNMVIKRINSTMSKCVYTSTPLVRATVCLLNAIKNIIGMNYIKATSSSSRLFTTLSGVMGYSFSSTLEASIVGKTFVGYAVYKSYAYVDNLMEEITISMASDNGYLIVKARAGYPGKPGSYYEISTLNAVGILVMFTRPLTTPQIMSMSGNTLIVLKRPIIKYAVVYESGGLLPKAVWLYHSKPTDRILLPFPMVTLMNPVFTSVRTTKLCQIKLAVVEKGDHSVSVIADYFTINTTVKGFEWNVLPAPCGATYLIKVDKSVALLNETNINIAVFPKSPALVLTKLNATSPFIIVTPYGSVRCPPTCYLLKPPSEMRLVVSDVARTASAELLLPAMAVNVNVPSPSNIPSKGCTVTLVSPVQVPVSVYSEGNALISLVVGPKPVHVAVPCNTKVTIKTPSYSTDLTPTNGAWIYICPLNYGTRGTAITINANSMVPPLSVSCDGGLHWADVKASKFIMLKPALASIRLVIVDKNDAKTSLIVARGVSSLTITPMEKSAGRKLKPFKGNDFVPVKVSVTPPNSSVTLMFVKGNEYVEYAINGTSTIGFPKAWLNSVVNLKIGRGLELHNVTLPPLQTAIGKSQVISPIYVMLLNRIPYNYHSIKIVVVKGQAPLLTKISVNGFNTTIRGSAVFVMPNDTARIEIGNKAFVVPANGQTVTINVPQKPPLPLTSELKVTVLVDDKPAKATLTLSDGTNAISYSINGNGVVMVPSSWLTKQLYIEIKSHGVICSTQIPAIQTKFANKNVTSPLVVILSTKSSDCYPVKLLIVGSKYLNVPSQAIVVVDGKYALKVYGSIILLYYKPEADIVINGNNYKLILDGGTAKFLVPPKSTKRKVITNITVGVSIAEALKKAGRWNPVKELPALLSLSAALALSLGVLQSGVQPSTAWGAAAFALAAFNVLVIMALLATVLLMYFRT